MPEQRSPGSLEEAMLDLLVKQVTEGLSADEERALEAADGAVASAYAHDFERAAAAISLAAIASDKEFPPQALRARIEQAAEAFSAPSNITELQAARETVSVKARSGMSAIGWYAAAACLVLALFGWLRPLETVKSPPTVQLPLTPPPITAPLLTPPAAPPTPAEERAALLARPESVKVTLSATKDPAAAGVTADAVWDPVTQRGFLRIVGLKPNDPRIQQYQAWIFDAKRDKRYPLSAGLFNVPANSPEVIVEIHGELPVQVAKAFAVTLENPGGVVVPALHHVVVLGAVS